MSGRRTIPGTGGATVEKSPGGYGIDRVIREADGSILGRVSVFSRDRVNPRRWVRSANTSDTVGYTLPEVVTELRARKAKA